MGRTALTRSFALALLLGALGCSEDSNTDAEATAVEQDVIVCGEAQGGRRREFYVLQAINRSLSHFPRLKEAVGLESVTGCDEARHFKRVYEAFEREHPGFDADEPWELPSVGEAPAGSAPKIEVEKLRDGQPPGAGYPRNPVVKLTQLADRFECTGVFIAKKWILTAAHCLAYTRPPPAQENLITASHLFGYAEYSIEFSDPAGQVQPGVTITSQSPDIFQYPHPLFKGSVFPGHDIALLYLRGSAQFDYDRVLPPVIQDGGAMRISLRPPSLGSDVTVAGFGAPLGHQEVASFPVSDIDTYNWAVRIPSMTTTICKGDSGGPASQLQDIVGGPQRVPVLLGTLIGEPGDPVSPCTDQGAQDWFTLMPAYVRFVETVLRRWNGRKFSCERQDMVGGGLGPESLACWGKSCGPDEKCPDDSYCQGGGEDLGDYLDGPCSACPDCSCVRGQCIPF